MPLLLAQTIATEHNAKHATAFAIEKAAIGVAFLVGSEEEVGALMLHPDTVSLVGKRLLDATKVWPRKSLCQSPSFALYLIGRVSCYMS